MRWTEQQLRDYEMRMYGKTERVSGMGLSDGTDDEAELHNEIIAYCKSKGWIYLHGSMAHRTHRTLGEPDFVILADGGRTFFIECKPEKGKLSTDQLGFAMHAQKLGHEVHLVRSYTGFIDLVL